MRALARMGGVGVILLGVAAAVPAQSLGEVAKQETERRKAVKATGKVYTNDNLRSDGTAAPAPAASQPAPSPASGSQSAVPPSPSGAQAPGQTGTSPAADET